MLAARGHRFEVVAVGGGGLLLLGAIERPTRDLDLIAIATPGGLVNAEPLPDALLAAARDVAAALGLSPDWINSGPADLLRFGLPPGFHERVTARVYGALVVHLAARFDQLHFKLYATVDQGPASKHFQDLRKLQPTAGELRAAARWVRTHDPSPPFREMLMQALQTLGVEPPDDL